MLSFCDALSYIRPYYSLVAYVPPFHGPPYSLVRGKRCGGDWPFFCGHFIQKTKWWNTLLRVGKVSRGGILVSTDFNWYEVVPRLEGIFTSHKSNAGYPRTNVISRVSKTVIGNRLTGFFIHNRWPAIVNFLILVNRETRLS